MEGGPLPPRRSHEASPVRVIAQLVEDPREGGGVAVGHEDTGLPVAHRIPNPVDIRGDDRQTPGARLDTGDPPALECRRADRHPGSGSELVTYWTGQVAVESDVWRQTHRPGKTLETRSVRSLTHDVELSIRKLAQHLGHRVEHYVDRLLRREPPDVEHRRL